MKIEAGLRLIGRHMCVHKEKVGSKRAVFHFIRYIISRVFLVKYKYREEKARREVGKQAALHVNAI